MESLISNLAIWALPVLLAITLHEAAHGYVARYFGDPTADRAGRITLNPLRHIDPVGTLLVPAGILGLSVLFGGGGILFGWAKPVPVDFGRLRRPKADMLWVAAAGPGANLLMAIGWALLFKLAISSPQGAFTIPMMKMADAGMQINGVLMLLNLLPIPPLDGGRIAVSLLPGRLAWHFSRIEPFGFPILLLLLFSGLLGAILGPMLAMFRFFLALIFGN
ncbi:MAG: site-2 protease family protein [Betaproteobacteria bacterium HGW-Betaproteobacteria-13]|jgi:Zn-dependent protease|uniref:Site-2 protease family protein n=1 Tax=Parazoarcus communis TaxID=41977 RepID=A0A2U8H6Q5_9RHOO|nr:site-2 protease family protein [Parazoarcus communis]AWI81343.1 site-2 protease family protein [Parazoarcus communis]PKO50805.1 MAG: site-2 protease family protein [Betaproteobacteria bacterium HGW-Betaproteobacteria-21]PKO80026.1 MAG: site-2 protease family protein [Betaproteobacteria bacterium HGW-Betaproteobacteria-13]